LGDGEVLWIPSLIGLGSRISADYSSLTALLNEECGQSISNFPIRFQAPQKNMLMKTMHSGSSFITVIINKRDSVAQLTLDIKAKSHNGNLLYSTSQGKVTGNKILIDPEETMVIEWK
jgi:beta-galactosidase